jgi:hypothetical protein
MSINPSITGLSNEILFMCHSPYLTSHIRQYQGPLLAYSRRPTLHITRRAEQARLLRKPERGLAFGARIPTSEARSGACGCVRPVRPKLPARAGDGRRRACPELVEGSFDLRNCISMQVNDTAKGGRYRNNPAEPVRGNPCLPGERETAPSLGVRLVNAGRKREAESGTAKPDGGDAWAGDHGQHKSRCVEASSCTNQPTLAG